jgi:hypothetical protein
MQKSGTIALNGMSLQVVTLRPKHLLFALAVAAAVAEFLTAGCSRPSAASPVNEPVASPVAQPPITTSAAPAASDPEVAPPAADHNAPIAVSQAATNEQVVKPKPPPADRTPTRPGEAEKITFDDLNLGMEANMVFRDFMLSPRVKDLDGKKVSIVGYMHGGSDTQSGIKQFILLKNTQCKFGPGGQADHLADVSLRPDHTTKFSPAPIKVEGTLRIQPFQGSDDNTWSIYRLEDAQIK